MDKYYDYKNLYTTALSTKNPEDLENLAEWLYQYGNSYWNGEYWNLGNGDRLFPIYKELDDGEYEIVGYELY